MPLQVILFGENSMDIEARVGEIASGLGASLEKGRKGVWTLEWLVAERKALLFRKKVIYIAKFRLDAEAGELIFSEMLKETGAGAGEGSGPGVSFSKGTYKSGKGGARRPVRGAGLPAGREVQAQPGLGRGAPPVRAGRGRGRLALYLSGYSLKVMGWISDPPYSFQARNTSGISAALGMACNEPDGTAAPARPAA